MEAREQRTTISSLAQGSEANKAQWSEDIRKALELIAGIQPTVRERDQKIVARQCLTLNESLMSRLELSAKTLANLHHKGLVKVEDFILQGMTPTLALNSFLDPVQANRVYDTVLTSV